MRKDVINELLNKVPGLQYYTISEEGLPNGNWFVFETSPLPPFDQIEKVIADINNDNEIYLQDNGTLKHLENCLAKEHNVNSKLKAAVKNISNQRFKIAVRESFDGIQNNQPVVISLEPEINLYMHPDHLHINAGDPCDNYYLPQSLCYTNNPAALGNDAYSRTLEAIQQTSIWLFRHQVWLATRNSGKGIWIGLEVKTEEKYQFEFLRDPYRKCRCGNNKNYHQCHLNEDFRKACELESPLLNKESSFNKFKDESGNVNLKEYTQWWIQNVKNPQYNIMARLKRLLR